MGDGAHDDAINAYREALLRGGPDADTSFNLANVLYAAGRKEEANERYRQAVELNPDHAEAWNNLGVVLGELERYDEAETALIRATSQQFSDAHFNLATNGPSGSGVRGVPPLGRFLEQGGYRPMDRICSTPIGGMILNSSYGCRMRWPQMALIDPVAVRCRIRLQDLLRLARLGQLFEFCSVCSNGSGTWNTMHRESNHVIVGVFPRR